MLGSAQVVSKKLLLWVNICGLCLYDLCLSIRMNALYSQNRIYDKHTEWYFLGRSTGRWLICRPDLRGTIGPLYKTVQYHNIWITGTSLQNVEPTWNTELIKYVHHGTLYDTCYPRFGNDRRCRTLVTGLPNRNAEKTDSYSCHLSDKHSLQMKLLPTIEKHLKQYK